MTPVAAVVLLAGSSSCGQCASGHRGIALELDSVTVSSTNGELADFGPDDQPQMQTVFLGDETTWSSFTIEAADPDNDMSIRINVGPQDGGADADPTPVAGSVRFHHPTVDCYGHDTPLLMLDFAGSLREEGWEPVPSTITAELNCQGVDVDVVAHIDQRS